MLSFVEIVEQRTKRDLIVKHLEGQLTRSILESLSLNSYEFMALMLKALRMKMMLATQQNQLTCQNFDLYEKMPSPIKQDIQQMANYLDEKQFSKKSYVDPKTDMHELDILDSIRFLKLVIVQEIQLSYFDTFFFFCLTFFKSDLGSIGHQETMAEVSKCLYLIIEQMPNLIQKYQESLLNFIKNANRIYFFIKHRKKRQGVKYSQSQKFLTQDFCYKTLIHLKITKESSFIEHWRKYSKFIGNCSDEYLFDFYKGILNKSPIYAAQILSDIFRIYDGDSVVDFLQMEIKFIELFTTLLKLVYTKKLELENKTKKKLREILFKIQKVGLRYDGSMLLNVLKQLI